MAVPLSWTWTICGIAVLTLVTTSVASEDNGAVERHDKSSPESATPSPEIETPSPEIANSSSEVATPSEKILSRHRRYLVFPEGSTFNSAFCLTVKTYVIRDTEIYTTGVAWGISYDLPNNSRALAASGAGIEPTELSRRGRGDRKDLYRRVERAADSAGLDGRACVLRAVCESRDLHTSGGKDKAPRSLGLELLRVMLNVPVDSLSPTEPVDHHEYATARQLGIEGGDCAQHFPTCPTSFVSLAATLLPASFI